MRSTPLSLRKHAGARRRMLVDSTTLLTSVQDFLREDDVRLDSIYLQLDTQKENNTALDSMNRHLILSSALALRFGDFLQHFTIYFLFF